jgi:hypothetical protein
LIRFFSLFFEAAMAVLADTPAADKVPQVGQQVLARYYAAVTHQAPKTKGIEMDMDFSARLPKLKKEGALLGRRIVSSLGKISFVIKSITGDSTVKQYVIAKYLAGESEMSEKANDAAITPKNYKFKYKRSESFNGRPIHIYELNPRKKQIGLFKGELWIDEETALPVRESGIFVKNPSVFLKKVNFTRTYAMYDGAALPARVESHVETRIAGAADLDIRYTNFAPESPATAQAQ